MPPPSPLPRRRLASGRRPSASREASAFGRKGGDLYYKFDVRNGKVVSGLCAFRKRKGVMFDIVGGWYDRERLTLLLQSTGNRIGDQWYSHMHQFRRTLEGFTLEHSLYDYGKTEANGRVYREHLIDSIEEVGVNDPTRVLPRRRG